MNSYAYLYFNLQGSKVLQRLFDLWKNQKLPVNLYPNWGVVLIISLRSIGNWANCSPIINAKCFRFDPTSCSFCFSWCSMSIGVEIVKIIRHIFKLPIDSILLYYPQVWCSDLDDLLYITKCTADQQDQKFYQVSTNFLFREVSNVIILRLAHMTGVNFA